jgi:hypothetical protein
MGKKQTAFEVALDLACESQAEECCPNDFGLCNWSKCRECQNEKNNAIHYDPKRDVACWKRHYLEKAEERMAIAGFSGPVGQEGKKQ